MFRILALDGGGIKGTFTAAVLAALEHETKTKTAEHFDLIAGTSTGGILAIGLALGFPAQKLLDFYVERGPTIFPNTSLVADRLGTLRQLFRTKHSHQVLKSELAAVLGERKFGDAATRLVIPTYDANVGRIFVMKTAHHPDFVHDVGAPAVDVALATSAAPTYFAAAKFPRHAGASYVDGGVWANSPALVAVVEALAFLNQSSSDIDILSIGTTNAPFNIARHASSGILKWNKGLLDLMFVGQMEAAIAQASLLANRNLHRIDFTAREGQYTLDDASRSTIEQLVSVGRAEAVKRENLDVVRQRFLNGNRVQPYQPYARP